MMKPFQLNLFDKRTPIETVVITPTKDMPIDVFKFCHRLAFFMELMERLPDGRVLWDPDVTEMYSEELAEAEYMGLQQDFFSMNMELPVAIFGEGILND